MVIGYAGTFLKAASAAPLGMMKIVFLGVLFGQNASKFVDQKTAAKISGANVSVVGIVFVLGAAMFFASLVNITLGLLIHQAEMEDKLQQPPPTLGSPARQEAALRPSQNCVAQCDRPKFTLVVVY